MDWCFSYDRCRNFRVYKQLVNLPVFKAFREIDLLKPIKWVIPVVFFGPGVTDVDLGSWLNEGTKKLTEKKFPRSVIKNRNL